MLTLMPPEEAARTVDLDDIDSLERARLNLQSLCWQLHLDSLRSGDGTWRLSRNTIAEKLGCDRCTAWDLLNVDLVNWGVVEVVEKRTKRKLTRYRYLPLETTLTESSFAT